MPFSIIRNDITKVHADAIVNTANPLPRIGRGTDEAIYRAAGVEKLLAARRKLGPIAPGEASVTDAFGLPAKYIIHTVGPVWRDGKDHEFETLSSCYRKSLALAKMLRCKSIAFPLISSGAYRFPKDKALSVALREIKTFLEGEDDEEMEVILVVFDSTAFQLSKELADHVKQYIDDKTAEAIRKGEYEGGRESFHSTFFRGQASGSMRPSLSDQLNSYGRIPSSSGRESWDREEEQASSGRESWDSEEEKASSGRESLRSEEAAPFPDDFLMDDAAYLPEAENLSAYSAPQSSKSFTQKKSEKQKEKSEKQKEKSEKQKVKTEKQKEKSDKQKEQSAKKGLPALFSKKAQKASGSYYASGMPIMPLREKALPEKPGKSLDDVMRQIGETFQQMLLRLIDEKSMTDVEVYKRANVDRKLFSKIRCNTDYVPKKMTAVAFAIALQLNLDETVDLLGRAGFAFSPVNKFDLIIEYCIENEIYDIFEINSILFSYHQPTLGC